MKGKFIIIALLFIAGTALVIFSVNQHRTGKAVSEGLYAPEFEVMDSSSGKKLLSADLKGKVLFVNFWASWCQPCKDEMPSIEALHREMFGNENFRMVTIPYKDSLQNALEYARAGGYTFPVYSDSKDSSSKNYGVTGVPETYLVDKKGILRKRVIGPVEWNSPDAKGFIISLLNE